MCFLVYHHGNICEVHDNMQFKIITMAQGSNSCQYNKAPQPVHSHDCVWSLAKVAPTIKYIICDKKLKTTCACPTLFNGTKCLLHTNTYICHES